MELSAPPTHHMTWLRFVYPLWWPATVGSKLQHSGTECIIGWVVRNSRCIVHGSTVYQGSHGPVVILSELFRYWQVHGSIPGNNFVFRGLLSFETG